MKEKTGTKRSKQLRSPKGVFQKPGQLRREPKKKEPAAAAKRGPSKNCRPPKEETDQDEEWPKGKLWRAANV